MNENETIDQAAQEQEDHESMVESTVDRQIGRTQMDTKVVRFEVAVRLEGDGSILGMPDIVCERIKEAIHQSENESVLYAAIGVSAHLESVTLLDIV